MIELEIDGKKVEVAEGSMVMHAAEKLGTFIPHFCYHKKLSIAANCRMCLVDIEKMPKPMPACATPVTQGMVVRTKSDKAVKAQQAVMEFLLINHPLDCPICDQGGECQLQDLAVGYGAGQSRYREEKRVVLPKDVGPLISMEEMSRCIHCTRCVRFGQEIAGVMELGMSHRGEHSEIETFVGASVDSELSGNMIDICPVGALTSKPFRYSARTWELSRRKTISPHDSTGANLIAQVKGHKVQRIVPFENESVNECWIADRDRFSYLALDSEDRLLKPMLKQDGRWQEVDWDFALESVAERLRGISQQFGSGAIGALVSPHATVEELHLARSLMSGLGSPNIDYRLRNAQFPPFEGVRHLGCRITELSTARTVLVVGSNLRKDHPLFAQRIRQAARKGAWVGRIGADASDWAMDLAHSTVLPSNQWVEFLAQVASAVAQERGVSSPLSVEVTEPAAELARQLMFGASPLILLGNAAAHHANASSLLALAQWLARALDGKFGYLTEAANTVGAQVVRAFPGEGGMSALDMLSGRCRALILLNVELDSDTVATARGLNLPGTEFVVSLTPFKTNLEVANVLLPISTFAETAGTFVNAEGRVQSFHAVTPPKGQSRPGWKVLRVLGNLLGLDGFEAQSAPEVCDEALRSRWDPSTGFLLDSVLSNNTEARVCVGDVQAPEPVVASIYQLDALVRRSSALQATRDAKTAWEVRS
ncbi:MAG: NADH-quinone oxidoreductase subunit NuoG [Rhodoferax sp.]